jgi:hypothetical protein
MQLKPQTETANEHRPENFDVIILVLKFSISRMKMKL